MNKTQRGWNSTLRNRGRRGRAIASQMDAVTAELYERAGGACEARWEDCEGREHLQRHHVTGRGVRGEHNAANLRLVCDSCHSKFPQQRARAMAAGFIREKRADDLITGCERVERRAFDPITQAKNGSEAKE